MIRRHDEAHRPSEIRRPSPLRRPPALRVRAARRPPASGAGHAVARPVPWVVDRSAPPLYRLVNTSGDVLSGVTVSICGRSRLRVSSPATIAPDASVVATVIGRDVASDTILVVRWFHPDGTEYLWNVSF